MDEAGGGFAAALTDSWCAGQRLVCVPKRAGKPSRVEGLGALGLCGGQGQVVEGRVGSEAVVEFVEPLAARTSGDCMCICCCRPVRR